MSFRDELIKLRTAKSITQEELADRIGVSRQAVTKWESGASVPDIEKLILLADFFEVSLDKLCGRGDTMYDIVKKKIEEKLPEKINDEDTMVITSRYIHYLESLGIPADKIIKGIDFCATGVQLTK